MRCRRGGRRSSPLAPKCGQPLPSASALLILGCGLLVCLCLFYLSALGCAALAATVACRCAWRHCVRISCGHLCRRSGLIFYCARHYHMCPQRQGAAASHAAANRRGGCARAFAGNKQPFRLRPLSGSLSLLTFVPGKLGVAVRCAASQCIVCGIPAGRGSEVCGIPMYRVRHPS